MGWVRLPSAAPRQSSCSGMIMREAGRERRGNRRERCTTTDEEGAERRRDHKEIEMRDKLMWISRKRAMN